MPSTGARRDSLVYQASIERGRIEGLRRENTIKKRKELSRQVSFKEVVEKLNDDGLELIKRTPDNEVPRLIVIINTCGEV